jgi:Membrane proteins related to metalloendopeptidases
MTIHHIPIGLSDQRPMPHKMIIIDHGHGMETRYAHMSKLFKKKVRLSSEVILSEQWATRGEALARISITKFD